VEPVTAIHWVLLMAISTLWAGGAVAYLRPAILAFIRRDLVLVLTVDVGDESKKAPFLYWKDHDLFAIGLEDEELGNLPPAVFVQGCMILAAHVSWVRGEAAILPPWAEVNNVTEKGVHLRTHVLDEEDFPPFLRNVTRGFGEPTHIGKLRRD
jgi:hypothetical protein